LPVKADTFAFGKELPILINDKSVSKCSAVLALPPFPIIQIEFWSAIHCKILPAAAFRSLSGIDSKLLKKSK
jgi:hypothetical protein